MKKISLIPVMMALVVFFTGCEKVEKSEMVLDVTKKATLKVYCYAQLDQTLQGLEVVPNGTQVMVRIDNNFFNPAATGYWSAIGQTENGMVQFEIPVTDQGVTVNIFPMEFTYNQVQPYGSNATTIAKIFRFTGGAAEGTVKPNEVRTHQANYTDMGTYNNTIQKVSKKFQLHAELNVTTSGLEYVPNGTIVYFYNNGWLSQKTIGNMGAVELDVPINENIYVRFQATKIVIEGTDTLPKNYLYDSYVGNYSVSSPVVETINCGNGTLWQ